MSHEKSNAPAKKLPPINMRYVKRENVSVDDCIGMYKLFSVYYQNTPFETFMADLSKKTGVHIAKRVTDGKVVGFSTAVSFLTEVDGKQVRMLFSGDTVMAKEYWGNPAFPQSFFRWVLAERLKHPFIELNWFLISMGYRTYLILANNFYDYYPNIDGENAHLKKVAFAAADTLFPGKLNRENGLVEFGDEACALSDFVTPINDKERQVPKIAFFEKCNPDWMNGSEMACAGSLSWSTFGRALLDMRRTLFKKGNRNAKKQASSSVVNHKPETVEITLSEIEQREIVASTTGNNAA